ncbi:unnamed protein product [Mytilus edulis]|uniref:Uncharacterized protein n=1 Tax=Mytilus edulis TaxID=6550 RepID=A0A8S3V9E2_MYTED|nr:unnamed protein product [Mytilus edulis]
MYPEKSTNTAVMYPENSTNTSVMYPEKSTNTAVMYPGKSTNTTVMYPVKGSTFYMIFKLFHFFEVIDLPEHTVTITDISDIDFAGHDGLRLGQNKESEQEIEEETEETEETNEDGNKKPLDKKGIKALYRKKSTEQHMRKVFGKHKVNYTHAQDKKFKMKRRTDFPNKKIKRVPLILFLLYLNRNA